MNEPTLEQWQTLAAIADQGTYAAAAEKLDKSTSTLTYTIQRLEIALGVKVLEKRGRKAQLTDAGTVLLRRARGLLGEANALQRIAQSLGQGQEAEIVLAVEILFPEPILIAALGKLYERFPDTRVELFEHVLSGTEDMLLQRKADLAITSGVPPGFMGESLIRLELLPVAAPDHPLHHLGHPVSEQDLSHYRQFVVRDSGLYRRRTTLRVDARYRTTVTHLDTSIQAIAAGQGFAWLPTDKIRLLLQDKRLKPLPMAVPSARYSQLSLVFSDRDLAGPATRFLADRLKEAVRQDSLAD